MKYNRVFFALNLLLWLVAAKAFAQPVYNNNNAIIEYQQGVTTAWTKVLDPYSSRRYLLIVNKGVAPVYVNFDSAGSTPTSGIPIPGGGSYEPISAPVNSIYMISGATSQPIVVIQGK